MKKKIQEFCWTIINWFFAGFALYTGTIFAEWLFR